MVLATLLFYFAFFYLVNPQFQMNFHLTNPTIDDENLQHDCLRVPAYVENDTQPYQIISYCMAESPTLFQIKQNNIDQKFTFMQLAQQNITSEQLYQWSASIDLIESYQLFLNEINNSKTSSMEMEKEVFYNCTFPYFGPQCQYVFSDYKSNYLSLTEFIHDYYRYNRYEPTLFTCYVHLECHRGPSPSCLDWSEICDGKVDCLNDEIDEKDCWQLELQQCHDDEYQCSDGQCIPQEFLYDDPDNPDCIDQTDEIITELSFFVDRYTYINGPTFGSEDASCVRRDNQKGSRNFFAEILTSSCVEQRNILLSQSMFSMKSNSTSNECWTAWKCLIRMPVEEYSIYPMSYHNIIYNEIIKTHCSNLTYIPALPILFSHIHLVYDKNAAIRGAQFLYEPNYICYNNQLLYVPDDHKTVLINNNTCRYYNDSRIRQNPRNAGWIQRYIVGLYRWLLRNTASIETRKEFLNGTVVYKCMHWPPYVSKRLVFDNVTYCFANGYTILSLFNTTCSTKNDVHYFKCPTTNECIPRHLAGDQLCQCTTYDGNYCDDENFDVSYARNHISFQTICDGFTHLSEKFLLDYNETDETNCQHWPSMHIYNHCDDIWDLPNGADEITCDQSPLINCPPNHHICVSPQTNQLICLPIEKANDGSIDCLGAQDEPIRCQAEMDYPYVYSFYCRNSDRSWCLQPGRICDNTQDCPNNEDEQACTSNDYLMSSQLHSICEQNYELYASDPVKTLCRHFIHNGQPWRIYFTLDQRMNLLKYSGEHNISQILPDRSITREIEYYQPRCHRGLDLQVWLDKQKNLTTNVCLCPPSYYGSQCQYQNQRVSLTLQFRVTSDSIQIPFIIIVSLIDHTDQRIRHSAEQFIYLPMKNCRRKYNIYLLYSTRPKDLSKVYSIHIDIYEKTTLNYRTSFIKTLNSSFLPVHRLVYILSIPPSIDDMGRCSNDECIHGKCLKYNDDQQNRTFCQCDRGWYGQYCTNQYDCQCSSTSICLGKLANNRSLCVCPLDKTGPRCLLNDNICQNNKTITCYNNGQCISTDQYGLSTNTFICLCRKGTYGDRCENIGTELILSFDNTISLLSSLVIFIHFIEVQINAPPIRTTTVKKMNVLEDSITIHWSLPFHIVFIELTDKTYYLIHLEKVYNSSLTIRKTIKSLDRCLNISEVFNQTITNFDLVRGIKYYHLPCQTNSSQLLCFYDRTHMCLCQEISDQERVTNCFEFDHEMSFDCSGKSGCINNGTCYQENTTCPRISVCQCPRCYSGTRCQFSTTSYTLSLDAILGYHIQQHLNISQQSTAVLISLIITIIITILGFINGGLCLITFKNPNTRESGCGVYLFVSSVITIIIMIIFLLKYLILLFSQMGSINNRLFLNVQCRSIDFLLRSTLTINEWLTTFIAIERAFILIKGVNFNKKKSQLVAKWMISGLILLVVIINIYDPIYRSLFDEDTDDEKRIWCIVKYPSAIETINSMISIFHFLVPFVLNMISAIIIIVKSARQQAVIHKNRTYKELLNEQIQQHKNLLVGPCVLVILGIPRLVIVFAPGCMKSSKDAWLYLLGYYISLVPPLLTFILFVLPSTAYKQAFKKAISYYRSTTRRNESE